MQAEGHGQGQSSLRNEGCTGKKQREQVGRVKSKERGGQRAQRAGQVQTVTVSALLIILRGT